MPLHIQLIIILLTGSFTFCLALGLMGYLFSRKANTLPPVPLFPGSKFPGFFAIFYTIFFILSFGMAAIQGALTQPSPDSNEIDMTQFAGNALIQILLYVPFLVLYFNLPSRDIESTSFCTKLKWIFFGLLAMIIPNQMLEFLGFTQWLVEATDCPPMQDVVETLKNGSPEIKIAMIIMAVIVAPITEECCFRGFVYNILKRWNGPVAAALASSMLFGAIHTSLAQFIPLTLFGLVQCYAYEKARSLWLPVVLHVLFNGLSSLAILYLM